MHYSLSCLLSFPLFISSPYFCPLPAFSHSFPSLHITSSLPCSLCFLFLLLLPLPPFLTHFSFSHTPFSPHSLPLSFLSLPLSVFFFFLPLFSLPSPPPPSLPPLSFPPLNSRYPSPDIFLLSQSFYEQALDRCKQEAIQDETYYNGIAVTTRYNLGRLYEGLCEFEQAESHYKV